MDIKFILQITVLIFASTFFGVFIACLMSAAGKATPAPDAVKDAALDRALRDITALSHRLMDSQCCGNCQGYDDCIVMNPGEVCAHWRPDNGTHLERREMHDINVAFVMRNQEARG